MALVPRTLRKPEPDFGKRIPRHGTSGRASATLWNYAGLGNESLFPDPFSTGWGPGYIADQTMAAMRNHHKIYQTGNNLINAILGDGGRCIPNINPYGPDKAEFKKSYEISRFCEYALRMMNSNPLTGESFVVSRQMLSCIYPGNKIAPITMRDQETGRYKDKRVLDTLVPWDNHGYAFWRDAYGNFTWIEVLGEEIGKSRFYPREKFFHLAWRPENGNPYGTRILSAVYESFYDDIQLDREEMAYLAQFGRASITITASKPPENGEKEEFGLEYRNGDPVMEPNPDYDPTEPADPVDNPPYTQKMGTEVQQNAIIFTDFSAGSVNSLEYGSLVVPFEVRAGGADMFRLKREQNARNIVGAMFGTHQVTEAEKSMSQDNASVGEGIAGLNVTEGKAMLETAEENQLLRALVIENYTEAGLDYLPYRDYGSGQNSRIPEVMNAVVGFVNSGAFSKEQYWDFCARNSLSLPYPDSEPVIVRVAGIGPNDGSGGADNKGGKNDKGNNGQGGNKSNPSGGGGGNPSR